MNKYKKNLNELRALSPFLEKIKNDSSNDGYVVNNITSLENILSLEDENVIEIQLMEYFKQWNFLKFYTAFPNLEFITILCDVAKNVCQGFNAGIKENEKYKTALEILMPNWDLDSAINRLFSFFDDGDFESNWNSLEEAYKYEKIGSEFFNFLSNKSIQFIKTMQLIVNLLSQEKCFDLLKQKNKQGQTLLYLLLAHYISNDLILKLIICTLSEGQLFGLLGEKDNRGVIAFSRLFYMRSNLIVFIWSKLHPEKLFYFLKLKDDKGKTLLSHAFDRRSKTEYTVAELKDIVAPFSPRELFELLTEEDNKADTVASFMALNYHELMKWVLATFKDENILLDFLVKKNKQGHTIFINLLNARVYRLELQEFLVSLSPEELLELFNEKDGSNVLLFTEVFEYVEKYDPEFMRFILTRFIEEVPLIREELFKLLKAKNLSGNTMLFYRENPELMQRILSLLPEEQRIELLTEPNNEGDTVFSKAFATHDDSSKILQVMLTSVTEARRFALLENTKSDTILGLQKTVNPAIWNIDTCLRFFKGEQWKALVSALYEHKVIDRGYLRQLGGDKHQLVLSWVSDFFKPKNDKGNVLYQALNYISDLSDWKTVFKNLSEQELFEQLTKKDNQGKSFLFDVLGKVELMQLIISAFTKEKLFELLTQEDDQGNLVLFHMLNNIELIKFIFNLFTTKKLLDLLEKDNRGNALFSYMLDKPELIHQIVPLLLLADRERLLNLVTEEKLFRLLTKKDTQKTPFIFTVSNSELMQLINLFKNRCFDLLTEKDNTGKSLLFYKLKEPKLVREILSSVPEGERFDLLEEKDDQENTLLSYVFNHAELIPQILPLFPKEKRIYLLVRKDIRGEWILDDYDVVEEVLIALPEVERFDLLERKDNQGKSLLSYLLDKPLTPLMLSLIPLEKRSESTPPKENLTNLSFFSLNKAEGGQVDNSKILDEDNDYANKV